jgi:hypothetical protein
MLGASEFGLAVVVVDRHAWQRVCSRSASYISLWRDAVRGANISFARTGPSCPDLLATSLHCRHFPSPLLLPLCRVRSFAGSSFRSRFPTTTGWCCPALPTNVYERSTHWVPPPSFSSPRCHEIPQSRLAILPPSHSRRVQLPPGGVLARRRDRRYCAVRPTWSFTSILQTHCPARGNARPMPALHLASDRCHFG